MNHELRGVWILIGVVINVRATLIARAFAGVECVGCRPSVGCFFILCTGMVRYVMKVLWVMVATGCGCDVRGDGLVCVA